MADSDAYIQRTLEANALREPVFRSVVHTLQLPPGSHGLDAGCGIGLQAKLLAEVVGPDGHVTGVDILPELVSYGAKWIEKAGPSNRIVFRVGDVSCLPFDDDSFDWAWSADCIGYPTGELMPLLEELGRVVRPGGSLILLGWSSQQLLPGYPLLEARLNATCSAYIPFLEDKGPASNFMRALGCFQGLGFESVEARSFVGNIQAPLSRDERTALISLFETLWGERQAGVTADDWADYQSLCLPDSPDFILNIPDYYAFFTYSMFQAKVPQ